MLLLSHEKVNVFSLWTVCWRLLCSLLRRNKQSNQSHPCPALLSWMRLPCPLFSHALCHVFFPNGLSVLCFCQRWAIASFLWEIVFSHNFHHKSTLWCNKRACVAVLLHPCCMILSWPQLSFRISALLWCVFSICSIFMPLVSLCFLHLLYIYATCVIGREPLCVRACPHMPMDFNDGTRTVQSEHISASELFIIYF